MHNSKADLNHGIKPISVSKINYLHKKKPAINYRLLL